MRASVHVCFCWCECVGVGVWVCGCVSALVRVSKCVLLYVIIHGWASLLVFAPSILCLCVLLPRA